MTIFYGSTLSFGGNFFKTPCPLSRRVSKVSTRRRKECSQIINLAVRGVKSDKYDKVITRNALV